MSRSNQETPAAKGASSKNTKKPAKSLKNASNTGIVSREQRLQRISELAYSFSEQRGFTQGNEEADWIQAEKEVDALLLK